MRVMGLDVGTKTIGVAVSDELWLTAQGIEVINRKGKQDLERIKELIDMYSVEMIIVGLPKNMNGTIGPRGEMCLTFGKELEEHLDVPVIFWDERLTTVAAERTLISADVSRKKRKTVIDKMAAILILQNYMDANPKGRKPNESQS